MDLIKVYRTLEKTWLVISVIAVLLSAYIVYADGFEKAKLYLVLPLICITVWLMRRKLRVSY